MRPNIYSTWSIISLLLRSVSPSLRQNIFSTLKSFNGYGCWCVFHHGLGQGQPQDQIDQLCQTLHQGYKCIRLDAEEENDTSCVPWDIAYVGPEDLLRPEAHDSECVKSNSRDHCAARTCTVESVFLYELLQFFYGGFYFREELKHNSGFDYDVTCTENGRVSRNIGIEESDSEASEENLHEACCGHYPIRTPYKFMVLGQHRYCCGNLTSNPIIRECCGPDAGYESEVC